MAEMNKRRSPTQELAAAPESQPRAKKLFLGNPSRFGFTKISLPPRNPPSPPLPSPHILRRCSSDPSKPSRAITPSISNSPPGSSPSGNSSGTLSNHQVPGDSPNVSDAVLSPAKPPLPPVFRRCVSDIATPRSRNPNFGDMDGLLLDFKKNETHVSKRWKRVKEKMKEMRQWCDQVVREGEEQDDDEEDGGSEVFNGGNLTEPETEEYVCVENVGHCFCIQFKCPCSKTYQILLSGNDCYYKLS